MSWFSGVKIMLNRLRNYKQFVNSLQVFCHAVTDVLSRHYKYFVTGLQDCFLYSVK